MGMRATSSVQPAWQMQLGARTRAASGTIHERLGPRVTGAALPRRSVWRGAPAAASRHR